MLISAVISILDYFGSILPARSVTVNHIISPIQGNSSIIYPEEVNEEVNGIEWIGDTIYISPMREISSIYISSIRGPIQGDIEPEEPSPSCQCPDVELWKSSDTSDGTGDHEAFK